MYKIIIVVLLMLLAPVFVWADSASMIELKPGINEITIKVANNCDIDLQSICVIVNEEDMPDGLHIFSNLQYINVPAKSKTKDGLLLRIEVNNDAAPGLYQIPFKIQDKANHSWSHKLNAELNTSKPGKYALLPNYPNPFNANTQISYFLENNQQQQTQLVIYDLLGKQIRTLVNKKQAAGTYNVIWDGKDEQGNDVATGIYFYKMCSGSFTKTRKMTLLK